MSLTEDQFWNNKKVLLTGHTGFKGSWLALWLHKLGAEVYGYALPPKGYPNLYEISDIDSFCSSSFEDLRDLTSLKAFFKKVEPEVVFHLGAQSLVRDSSKDPIETLSTNIIGTANVFEAAQKTQGLKAVINITSDKCYQNDEKNFAFRESDPLGGRDPYSASKACSEIVTEAYRRSFFAQSGIALASARAGNVIGGGDWAIDRLIPDIIQAFTAKMPVQVRYPYAIRPWQYVLEPLSGYLKLAERLCTNLQGFDTAWNFGPDTQDTKEVLWVVKRMAERWGNEAKWELSPEQHFHEAQHLTLDTSKAKRELNWSPITDLEFAIGEIIEWHRSFSSQENMHLKCLEQIARFENLYSGGHQ